MRLILRITLLIAICACSVIYVTAQEDYQTIVDLEASLNDLYGREKLLALDELTEYYSGRDPRKAMRYARQTVDLIERMYKQGRKPKAGEVNFIVNAYTQLGRLEYEKGMYSSSRQNFTKASIAGNRSSDPNAAGTAESYIRKIDSLVADGSVKANFFTKNLSDLNIGKSITGAVEGATLEAEVVQGQLKESRGDFLGAIGHYQEAINLLRNTGNEKRINALHLKIAGMYDSLGQHQEARMMLDNVLSDIAQGDHMDPVEMTGRTQDRNSDDPANTGPDLKQETSNLKAIADELARNKEYEKSLEYYKLYQGLARQMYEDSIRSAVEDESHEREIMMLSQQKDIADLNLKAAKAERVKQIRVRNTLIFLSICMLVAGVIVAYFYVSKRREHGRLIKAYKDLDQTKTKLENAEKRIVRLLAQQVSGDIANELIADDSKVLGERRFVCIMFLDIRNFTTRAETMTPEELILYQNNVFSMMIDTVQKRHGNINQLLGDGFMATFGAPVSHGNDCQNAFDAARDILKELGEKIDDGSIPHTRVGIGLHAGYVVTGNVGSDKRKQYSITGNAVIVASRVEQLNKTYKSQLIITEDVYNNLDKPLTLDQPFLEVTVKGRTQPVKILKIA
jgi:class 3 adenylate cyclase